MSAVDARQDDPLSEESAMSTSVKSEVSSQACNILMELREQGELCDAVIRVGDQVFPVHRNILSACSTFFRALFTGKVGEPPHQQHEFTLTQINPDTMAAIIEYAYTRHAKVTASNVEQLLPAADHFHVMGLVKACCEFLVAELCPQNCIGVRKFAHSYFCPALERQALIYTLVNFNSVFTTSNEFLQLDIEEVSALLKSDNLNVRTEELVFDALCRWIDFNPEKRKQHIARLLKTIRLGLLTTGFFVEKVKPHEYVKESEQCRPIVIETLRFLYELDMDDRREVDMTNPIARPRIPYEVMFVIGGWSGGTPTNMVETYDTRADRWVVCPVADAGARAYHGMITMGHIIYIIGGFDGVEYFNSCRTFDPVNKVWAEAPPMNCKRCYVSVALLDGFIYAMGGFDGHVRQNSVERFTKETNQWSMIRPMHHQRSDASATTLNGKVFICGGFNGQECLNTAEYFDPVTSQWTLITSMNNRRSGVGVIAYNSCLYALGGFNGVTRMNTGERYCPRTRQWVDIPEMYSPRSNFATEIIDDMLFAIGGFNGVTTIFNVECYDSSADEWYDATDMSLYRSALSACVVKGLPNVQEFIYQNRVVNDLDASTTVDPPQPSDVAL